MGLLDLLFGKKAITNKNLIVHRNNISTCTTDNLCIHPDIKDLLWVADGMRKNYTNSKKEEVYEFNGVRIVFSSMNQDEPSLIYTKLPLANVQNISAVERPPYYPTYAQLTPQQKYVYWQLLANPYNPNIDIGFVFILYYGLERHLLNGNYEKAFEVILKLRDVHSNKSFQSYSANALILTCLCKQRADLAYKFMNSLDKDFELHFSDNLFILCKFSLDIPLTAKDIMRLAKSFEFSNMNYIKNNPELFVEILANNMTEKYYRDTLLIGDFITVSENKKARKQSVPIFANVSIIDKMIDVPLLIESFKFKKAMYDLLETTHEHVKSKVAELRKNGELQQNNKKITKIVVAPTFDYVSEKELVSNFNKCKPYSLNRHFALIDLQNFYYKCRNIDNIYLEKCIEFCLVDINSLTEMQQSYFGDEISRVKQLSRIYTKKEMDYQISEIKAFNGTIPAFKRLAIIYERQKEFIKAIEICDKAIAYYNGVNACAEVAEFEERKAKLSTKIK